MSDREHISYRVDRARGPAAVRHAPRLQSLRNRSRRVASKKCYRSWGAVHPCETVLFAGALFSLAVMRHRGVDRILTFDADFDHVANISKLH